jgi:hypothetical protein
MVVSAPVAGARVVEEGILAELGEDGANKG